MDAERSFKAWLLALGLASLAGLVAVILALRLGKPVESVRRPSGVNGQALTGMEVFTANDSVGVIELDGVKYYATRLRWNEFSEPMYVIGPRVPDGE